MAKTTEPTTEIRAAVDKLAADFSNYATTPVESGGDTNRNASGGRHTNEPPTIEHFLAFHHSGKHQGALIAGLIVFTILIVGTWMLLMHQTVRTITFNDTAEERLFQNSEDELSTLLERFNDDVSNRAALTAEVEQQTAQNTALQKSQLRSVLGAALTASSTTEQPN